MSAAVSGIETGRYVETAPGIRLHCAQAGAPDAPLLLFLHGFPEFWFAWRALLPRFADRWHAVAPDLRGFNLSSAPQAPEAYRIEALISDIDGLIHGLGHERAVIVAHDWGGAVAWSYAMARPQRVSRLVILNAPHPVPFARLLAHDAEQQAASAYMNWLRKPEAEALLAEEDFARFDRFFVGLSPAPWFDAPTRAAYHAAWSQPGALTGSLNYYRASPLYPPVGDDPGARRLELDPAAFRVHVPTRVIWGEADTALKPSLLDGLEELVPDLSLVRLPGRSHWLVHEAPEAVSTLIREFIEP